jgi:ribonuclease D
VTYLRVIYEALAKELEKTGRAGWVQEEERTLKDPATYRLEPADAWRRLKARPGNKRFFAVLSGVAAWREREAQTRDVPRNRILKDEALLEIAAHPPTEAGALDEIRALPNGYANSRQGKALLAVVQEAMANPPLEGGPQPERRRARDPSPAALDLLRTLLRLRAQAYRVAPRLVANTDDLERLAAGEDDGVAALQGWRADVFGRDAVALRDGNLAIALENGEAIVIETPREGKTRAKSRQAV